MSKIKTARALNALIIKKDKAVTLSFSRKPFQYESENIFPTGRSCIINRIAFDSSTLTREKESDS